MKDKIFPIPQNYFRLGKLKKVDIEEKTIIIEASNKIPVGNCGDVVAVNTKAARIMCDLYGIPTPSYQCAAQSSEGTLKQLARSKTMCIAEVVKLYESLPTIVNHFSYSIKNKEALNSAMELLNMTPKHLLSWCSTQMAHFLDACTQINKVKSITALYILAPFNLFLKSFQKVKNKK